MSFPKKTLDIRGRIERKWILPSLEINPENTTILKNLFTSNGFSIQTFDAPITTSIYYYPCGKIEEMGFNITIRFRVYSKNKHRNLKLSETQGKYEIKFTIFSGTHKGLRQCKITWFGKLKSKLSLTFLLSKLNHSLTPDLVEKVRNKFFFQSECFFTPMFAISYKRERFLDPQFNTTVTLDEGINIYLCDIKNSQILFKPIKHKKRYILEWKVSDERILANYKQIISFLSKTYNMVTYTNKEVDAISIILKRKYLT